MAQEYRRSRSRRAMELREAAKELILALSGVAVRAPEPQARRYGAAFDNLSRVLGLEPRTERARWVDGECVMIQLPPGLAGGGER
jgi:hypothetical protein